MDVGLMTMKMFSFLSLSFLGHVVPVHWACPLPQTSEFTLFPPPLYLLLAELGRDYLVWKRIRLLSWAKHQIRALTLCIILCMTLRSALDPVSFYPSTGQCADMVSAPRIFGSFLPLRMHWFALLSVSSQLHVCMCVFVWSSEFIRETYWKVIL